MLSRLWWVLLFLVPGRALDDLGDDALELEIIERGDTGQLRGFDLVDDDYFDYQRDFPTSILQFSSQEIRVPLEISIEFKATVPINESDVIFVRLPRFTSGAGDGIPGRSGDILTSWTTYFKATWHEGSFDHSSLPFRNSTIELQVLPGRSLSPDTKYNVIIFELNGIRAHCSHDTDADDVTISTNATGSTEIERPFTSTQRVGNGCIWLLDCSGHGNCDTCLQRCNCDEGWGGDIRRGPLSVSPPRDATIDCSTRTCPMGRAVRYVPLSTLEAHVNYTECSSNGFCDRISGACDCSDGWGGEACQRRLCPNDCSGHGRCLNMEEMALASDALPLSATETTDSLDNSTDGVLYGTVDEREKGAWDFESNFGCVCDSSWEVGLASGETQQPEYFGADCSLRHCPTGDDPRTPADDETDCSNKTAPGYRGVGATDNLCHVDCSNRGRCNFATGRCACYEGFYGDNCGRMSPWARQTADDSSPN